MEELREDVRKFRSPEHETGPLFVNRWSPRAMDGDVSDSELMGLFEAARWAPSSYNNQPWRFIFARNGSAHWQTFFSLLAEANQSWAGKASVLVVVVSGKNFEHNGRPSRSHSLDTGAAWENLALEGSRRGLAVHGMEGFDYERAHKVLNVPDGFAVELMVAIGRRGKRTELPEKLQPLEQPSGRKPLREIVFEGLFGRAPHAASD